MTTNSAIAIESENENSFHEMVEAIGRRLHEVAPNGLFTTDANLWGSYLDSFAPEDRQHHNCNTCRHFIERYGNLVTINARGEIESALWNVLVRFVPTEYMKALETMCQMTERAKITGVFISDIEKLGPYVTPYSEKHNREWTHLTASIPRALVNRNKAKNASQLMAEKLEDHKNVLRALDEFPKDLVAQAVAILSSDATYRAEHVIGPAKWLLELHQDCEKRNRSTMVWRAIAAAPSGFCHPRSSMVGTLLEDLASGMPAQDCQRRFADKMNPLKYQRPQAAPTAGNIEAAEKLVEKLGIARSLERRFANLEDIECFWKPQPSKAESHGVFGHLKAQKNSGPSGTVDGGKITFRKFERDVLPSAKSIKVSVPAVGSFVAMTTAVHPDAPPILQWDREEKRNPVAWYLYSGGSLCRNWDMIAGSLVEVTGLALKPSMIGGCYHHGEGAIFILERCRDRRGGSTLALFPEILKTELREARATIEAFSKAGHLPGAETSTACGLMCSSDNPVRVVVDNGVALTAYNIDRFE